jgi:uncharacterized BrkB/YihY/UPF0761 family membrane protein
MIAEHHFSRPILRIHPCALTFSITLSLFVSLIFLFSQTYSFHSNQFQSESFKIESESAQKQIAHKQAPSFLAIFHSNLASINHHTSLSSLNLLNGSFISFVPENTLTNHIAARAPPFHLSI